MAKSDWTLLLDYGTSSSIVGVGAADGRLEPVEVAGALTTPSGVWADSQGRLVVGLAAQRQARLAPERWARAPKRSLRPESSLRLGQTEVEVIAAVAEVLKHLGAEAVLRQGAPPREVRVTCPTSWEDDRRQTLLEAVRRAGFGAPAVKGGSYLVDGLVATALGLAQRGQVPEGARIAIYDLGGAGFEAAVLESTPDGLTVLASGGIEGLGGELFDDLLFRQVVNQALTEWDEEVARHLVDPPNATWRRAAEDLFREVRRAKEELSTGTVAAIDTAAVLGRSLKLDRRQLEEVLGPQVGSTAREFASILERAEVSPADLHEVFLTGGSSRIPAVGRTLFEYLGVTPTLVSDPKSVMLAGAALWRPDHRQTDSVGDSVGAAAVTTTAATATVAATNGVPAPRAAMKALADESVDDKAVVEEAAVEEAAVEEATVEEATTAEAASDADAIDADADAVEAGAIEADDPALEEPGSVPAESVEEPVSAPITVVRISASRPPDDARPAPQLAIRPAPSAAATPGPGILRTETPVNGHSRPPVNGHSRSPVPAAAPSAAVIPSPRPAGARSRRRRRVPLIVAAAAVIVVVATFAVNAVVGGRTDARISPAEAAAAPTSDLVTGLRVRVKGITVNLSWAPFDGADGYRLYRDPETTQQVVRTVTGTSVTDRPGDSERHTYSVVALKKSSIASRPAELVTAKAKAPYGGAQAIASLWPDLVPEKPGRVGSSGQTCLTQGLVSQYANGEIRCAYPNDVRLQIFSYESSSDRDHRAQLLASEPRVKESTWSATTHQESGSLLTYQRTGIKSTAWRWWTIEQAPTFAMQATWPGHSASDLAEWFSDEISAR